VPPSFPRAITRGARTACEAPPLAALTPEELRLASFVKIIQGRAVARAHP